MHKKVNILNVTETVHLKMVKMKLPYIHYTTIKKKLLISISFHPQTHIFPPKATTLKYWNSFSWYLIQHFYIIYIIMLFVDLSITYIFSAMLEEAYKTSSTPNTNISLLLIPFKWQHHNFGLNKSTDIKFKLLPVSNSPNFLRIYYIFS